MSNITFQYAYWFLAHSAKKIGAWGMIGIAFAIASLLFYATKIPEIETLIEEVQAAKEEANTKINKTRIASEELSPQNNLEEINRFYAIFPKATALPEALSSIYEIANKQKLALNSGDYKFNKVKQASVLDEKNLTRYEIVLPVKGKYISIRTFVAEVLQKLPALALMDMQIRRENSLSQSVEARLVFVLFVKGELW
jgi:Tfp pilus assembly protein PilO